VRLRVLAGLRCYRRRRRLHGAGFRLGEAQTAAAPPGIESSGSRTPCRLVVHVTMHSTARAFPALTVLTSRFNRRQCPSTNRADRKVFVTNPRMTAAEVHSHRFLPQLTTL